MTNQELEKILKMRTHFQRICNENSDELRMAIQQIQKMKPAIEQASQNIRKLFKDGTLPKMEEAVKFLQDQHRLAKSFRETAEGWDKVNKICFERGWFPCGEWGPDAGRRVLKLHKEGKIDQLDNEICDFYNERILQIVDEWNYLDNLDKRRLKIIKQAIVAHLNGYYEAAIIVLFSQIEGQIRDDLEIKGDINHSDLLKEYKVNIKTKKDKRLLKEIYVDIIFTSMLNKLFKRNGYNKRSGEVTFTRHSALHGFYLDSYSRIKSTKLIMLLNFIITTSTWVQLKNDASIR